MEDPCPRHLYLTVLEKGGTSKTAGKDAQNKETTKGTEATERGVGG